MKNERIFIGTIMQCTECTDVPHFTMEGLGGIDSFGHMETKEEVYKEDAVLVKTKNGLYIDIESLNLSIIPYLYVENKTWVHNGEPYMFSSSYGSYRGQLFVASDSIKPYFQDDKLGGVSLLKLKRDVRKKK